MKKIKGNLITLALQGEFDVIAHGVNCFNTQKNGIAKDMVKHFNTDTFPMELSRKGDYGKLGNIDFMQYTLYKGNLDGKGPSFACRQDCIPYSTNDLTVINCYTQYYHKRNCPSYVEGMQLFNEDAFRMCLDKFGYYFASKKIGLPYIGCGLAGGDIERLEEMICDKYYLNITLVEYDGTNVNPIYNS